MTVDMDDTLMASSSTHGLGLYDAGFPNPGCSPSTPGPLMVLRDGTLMDINDGTCDVGGVATSVTVDVLLTDSDDADARVLADAEVCGLTDVLL